MPLTSPLTRTDVSGRSCRRISKASSVTVSGRLASSGRITRSVYRAGRRRPPPPGSAADLGHALGRPDEALLVDQVALLLQPDRALDHACDVAVGDAASEQVAQRGLRERDQAGPEAAFGRQPDPVAGGAERLRHGGDEPDPAGDAVCE